MAFGYETKAGVPERGASYAILMDHLRECQKHAAILAHLHNTEGNSRDKLLAQGWLMIAEMFRKTQHTVTKLAQGRILG
jgi:hypothetical protein